MTKNLLHLFPLLFSFLVLSQVSQKVCAQSNSGDYTSEATPVITVNDGFPSVNPMVSVDGTRLYVTKQNHPDNIGGSQGTQDLWYAQRLDGKWVSMTNDLPGINSSANDLVVGQSANGERLYLIQYDSIVTGSQKIQVFKEVLGRFVPSHSISIPGLVFHSGYFGFFVSKDEKYVLISMKGEYSFGKEDLYVSIKGDRGWSSPIHLGARINTLGFEMSPYLSDDGKTIYFSSEGHTGFGNADIFSSRRLDESWTRWSRPSNLGSLVNSEAFEAYFTLDEPRHRAYFISNTGNKSGQMYSIEYKESDDGPMLNSHANASGFLKLEKLPAMNVKLNLLDDKNQVVQSIMTTEEGFFNFQAFMPDRNYKISVDETQKAELEDAEIYMTNDLGAKMVFMNNPDLGVFGFKVLSDKRIGEYSEVEKLAQNGKIVDKPTKITGKVASYGTLVESVKLNLIDDRNQIVQTIETDEKGFFEFSTNAAEKSYFLSVEGDGPGLVDVYEIYLTNANEEGDIVVSKTDKHLFEFRALLDTPEGPKLLLMAEEDLPISAAILDKYGLKANDDEESALTGFLRLDKLPVINTQISLIDENDNVIKVATTDDHGKFEFDKIFKEGRYELKLNDDQKEQLKNSEIYLARNPNDMLFYLNDGRNGMFAFKKLAKKMPETLYSLENEVNTGKVVSENRTLNGKFAYESLPKEGVRLRLLDEHENLIQITDVNPDGTFSFENYTVDKNYFINVENNHGLADIFEVYLSGNNKNVLVNRLNKYVFAFRILPTQDVMLTQAFEAEESAEYRPGMGVVNTKEMSVFYEFDLKQLEQNQFFTLDRVLQEVENNFTIILRLSREVETANGIEKSTISLLDAMRVKDALVKMNVEEEQIEFKNNGSDQLLIFIQSRS